MKFGLIHYNTPGDTLDAFLDYAADSGFEAVELMSGDVWPQDERDPEKRAGQVRQQVESRGLVVAAIGAGNDFVVVDEAEIGAQVDRMERICRLALLLGTNVVRSEGGARKPQVPQDKEVDAMAECFKRCAPFLEREKVSLGVDNHGVVTNDAELQLRLLEKVGSPFVGATLDTMNYRWMGHSVQTCNRFYDLIAPQVKHVHFKDGTGSRETYVGAALGEGEIDLDRALRALTRHGYDGALCAEWEGRGDKGDGYRACLEWMKKNVQR